MNLYKRGHIQSKSNALALGLFNLSLSKRSKGLALSLSKGFTLIELLVVIAIIGLLSTIVLASMSTARQKGNDTRRISDIKSIQLALENYYDQNSSSYPTQLSALAPNYISVVPKDPKTTNDYVYSALQGAAPAASTCGSYHLGSIMEQSSNTALSQDFDGTTGGAYGTGKSDGAICTGAAADFTGASTDCASGAGTELCYDVRP